MRVGIGLDAHALVKGRKLILGGVEIGWHKGLEGHSGGQRQVYQYGPPRLCRTGRGHCDPGDRND